MSGEHLVWIDCEMTGLDPEADALIEIAAVVTDADLTVLGEPVCRVIAPPDAALEQMSDYVRQMHVESGLLEDLASGVSMDQAQQDVLDYVKAHVPVGGKAPLAGNTVGMDRIFVERDMPDLAAYLHYRVVDVSSIKELVRRWYPRVFFNAPEKSGGHRALGDIYDSIAELRYYRKTVFVEAPGPDSDTAKAAAESTEHDGASSPTP